MSLIERAVERLDQLRQAGVVMPETAPATLLQGSVAPLTPAPAAPAPVVPPAVPVQAAPASRAVEIDLERLAGLGLVTPLDARSTIAEEYRVIKRPLLRNFTGKGAAPVARGNLIMVTSSVPGEGKSFSSVNLAMSIALELDHTVLLVDADVSKPSVLNLLGLPPEKGLMDVLLDDRLELPDVLLRTNVEKLSLLPAGMPNSRATELLASESMNQLLNELATRYPDRIIIFDSPPLLVTTEARVLASHMGQVVMVVEAGRTTHGMVRNALATIEACPVKLMLLNKSQVTGPGGYYGYGYGYGYGKGGDAR